MQKIPVSRDIGYLKYDTIILNNKYNIKRVQVLNYEVIRDQVHCQKHDQRVISALK